MLVNDYLYRKNLKKIGYAFNPNDLTDFEVQYLVLCESTFNKLESDKINNQMKKGKARRR